MKKIIFFRENILKWFKENSRNYDWRKGDISSYEHIIAEVLLQRTQANTITKFYPNFINEFTSWEDIDSAMTEELEEALKPIGLYKQRAKRLKKLAKEVIIRDGEIPENYDELLELPMIGQYIANSIMSVVREDPYPMLDVNMARVVERFFGPRKKADIRYDEYLQELAYKVVNVRNSKELNWAILDFAAQICKSRKPRCKECILQSKCKYYKNKTIYD